LRADVKEGIAMAEIARPKNTAAVITIFFMSDFL